MPLFGPPNVEKLKAKKNVKGLIKALTYGKKYKHRKIRLAAVKALGEIGDETAIEPLRKYLNQYSYKGTEHSTAASALLRIGMSLSLQGDPRAIPALTAVVHDKDYQIRQSAANAFVELGEKAVPALLNFHKNRSPDVRNFALNTIVKIGESATPELIKSLRTSDSKAKVFALRALDELKWQPGNDESAVLYWIAKEEWTQCGSVGPKAVPLLIDAINDGKAGAVTALAQIEDPRVLPALIKALQTSLGNNVQRAAARALGRIGDATAITPLMSALVNPQKNVQQEAAEALCQIKDLQAIEAIIPLLDPQKEQVAHAVKSALVGLGDPCAPYLIKALKKREAALILPIIQTLGAIGNAQAVPELIPFLKSEDDQVVMATADALGAIGDVRSTNEIKLVLVHSNPQVRTHIADALDKLNWKPDQDRLSALYWIERKNWHQCVAIGGAALEPLLDVLKQSNNDSIQQKVMKALGEIGDPQAIEPISAFLSHKYYWVRKSAVDALAEIADPAALKPLKVALTDKDDKVQKAAYAALGKIGDEECIKILVQALPRSEAAETLIKLGQAAVEPLIEQLNCDDSMVRRISAKTLGTIRDPRSVEPLLASLNDNDTFVRRAATLALGKFGDESVLDTLLNQLENSDSETVRISTVEAVADIADPKAVTPLLQILQNEHESISLKKTIIGQLEKFHDPRIVDVLISLVEDDRTKLQPEAIRALGNIGDKRATEALIDQLPSFDAINALGKIGDSRAVQPLIKMLPDANFNNFKILLNALAMLYRSGKLDENHKQLILKQGSALKRREDYYTHEDEGCFGERIHTDNHADFHKMI